MSADDKQLNHFKAKIMRDGEEIHQCLKAWDQEGDNKSLTAVVRGRLILTNQRVCFFKKIMLSERLDAIELSQLRAYETSKLAKATYIKLDGYGNKVEVGVWADDDTKKEFFTALDRLIAGNRGDSPHQSRPVAPEETPIEKIRKLAALKDEGILTEEEFQSKRAELLAQV